MRNRGRRSGTSTVIAYHGVGRCAASHDPHGLVLPIERFEAQMAFLAKHRAVVPLADIVDGHVHSRKPTVAITFDDGYRSVLEHAAPVLQQYGFPAVCFVPTLWIGRHNEWDEFSSTDCSLEVMTHEELHRAESLGIRIESHAHTHKDLAAMTTKEAARDLQLSAVRLREVMGRPARYLAYPYGADCPSWLQVAAERAGFEAAFTIRRPGLGPFTRERVVIRRTDGRALFAFKTSGLYLSVRHSRLTKTAFRAARPLTTRLEIEVER